MKINTGKKTSVKIGTDKNSGKKEVPTEFVRQKAYEIFEKRGKTHGDDMSDWFKAEKLVQAELKR